MANATSVRGKRGAETTNPGKKNPAADAAVGGKRGIDLLHDPVLNKATAYTEAERQALGLVGLVPDVTESEDLQLRRVMQAAGFELRQLSYFNSILFPAALAAWAGEKLARVGADPRPRVPPPVLNTLLTTVFSMEKYLLRGLTLPYGLSLIALARRSS